MNRQPQDGVMPDDVFGRGTVHLCPALQPEKQLSRVQNPHAKHIVQRPGIRSEPRLAGTVSQDQAAFGIGHEAGCRVIGHQPECAPTFA
jgi:hypothetical protein